MAGILLNPGFQVSRQRSFLVVAPRRYSAEYGFLER
jgi:hypothetical protein